MTSDYNSERFSFENDGNWITFEKPTSLVRKPGFVRKNRQREEMDFFFTMFEHIAGDAALDVIDDLEPSEFEKLTEIFVKHLGGEAGGIFELLTLLDVEETRGAIEYDLIQLGLRLRYLGDERLAWGDLIAIVRHAGPQTATFRAIHGDEEGEWTLTNHLLALMADSLRIGNWQRAGDKRNPAPKPIPRPGIDDDSETNTYGSAPIPRADMAAWLGWTN